MLVPDVSNRSIAELLSLQGKTSVITGGARGIGLAIGKRFVEAGARLLIADLNEGAAIEAARQLDASGRVVSTCKLDVTQSASIHNAAEIAMQQFGSIDIWVNNAGIYPHSPVLEMAEEEWDQVLNVNLRGTFLGGKEAGTRMARAGKGGVILNLASTAAFRAGDGGIAHYVSSKHGIIGLTKSLAVELGTYNIRVLALAPTLADTPGIQLSRPEDLRNPETVAHWPLKRICLPDDVARVALFCASDMSMLMTGSTLLIDAGRQAV